MSNEEKKNPAKEAFELTMFRRASESVDRLKQFMGYGQANFLSYIVVNETLLLLEKLQIMDPESYSKAVAGFRQGEIMNQRGYCCDAGCYKQLTPLAERCEFSMPVQQLLGNFCAECAEQLAKDQAEEEKAGAAGDDEYMKEYQEELDRERKLP